MSESHRADCNSDPNRQPSALLLAPPAAREFPVLEQMLFGMGTEEEAAALAPQQAPRLQSLQLVQTLTTAVCVSSGSKHLPWPV